MKITYIKQSSFLLEWEHSIWLFDYFAGQLPDLDPSKKLIVFSSHGHKDHFSQELFTQTVGHPDSLYLLSDDISIDQLTASSNLSPSQKIACVSLSPHRSYLFDDNAGNQIEVQTLLSTDLGVAFLIRYCDRTIYHSGDLYWWIWNGESPQETQDMKFRFFKEVDLLKGVHIDIAFLLLDPRLEDNFAKGFDVVMRTADIDSVFPMHYWGDPSVNQKLMKMECSQPYRQKVHPVLYEGQTFTL